MKRISTLFYAPLVLLINQTVASSGLFLNGSGTIDNSNVMNAGVSYATNTTITVSSTGTIPVNGTSGSLTVTNTGKTYNAYNISAMLPDEWLGVIQNATDCTTIAPGDTCTLTFTSTTPYIAQGGITVTGENITSPPTTALAFSIEGYLVWSVSGTSPSATAHVIGSSNASNSQAWSKTDDDIPGINNNSKAPPCNGANDGSCDTEQIVAHYGTPYTNYAAGLCYKITSDNSGTVTVGTWYLPSICELVTPPGGNLGCMNFYSVRDNLKALGFSSLSGTYWSSTQSVVDPTGNALAWDSNDTFGELSESKDTLSNIICARTFTY